MRKKDKQYGVRSQPRLFLDWAGSRGAASAEEKAPEEGVTLWKDKQLVC